MHAHEMHAYKVHAYMRCAPLGCTPTRCTSMRYIPSERHVHKSVGVHLIGVCLGGSDFSIWAFGESSPMPHRIERIGITELKLELGGLRSRIEMETLTIV
jgi:hypothetical protein